jgi:hypothetical protein
MGNLEPAKYPDPFYIFVKQANFMTWHNFNLGQFCSSAFAEATNDPTKVDDYLNGRLEVLPFVPNPALTGFVSRFANNVSTYYRVEWDAEHARRVHAPEAPSRLSAVYALGSYTDCQAVAQAYGWSLEQVETFRAVEHPLLRIRRVNMEIVRLARELYSVASWGPEDIDAIWSAYWNGADDLTLDVPVPPDRRETSSSGCIWEYLIDGCVMKAGTVTPPEPPQHGQSSTRPPTGFAKRTARPR